VTAAAVRDFRLPKNVPADAFKSPEPVVEEILKVPVVEIGGVVGCDDVNSTD
jgi:hypothetical protein